MTRSLIGRGRPAGRRSRWGVAVGFAVAVAVSVTPVASASSRPASVGESLEGLLGPATGGCSWHAQYGDGGQTVLETDTNAAYWATSYLSLPGGGMTIHGTFPQARNMSFTVYHLSGAVRGGHLYDAQIVPDAGGVNPFQTGESGTGTYTLHVVAAPTPADPAPNTLYTNTQATTDVELVYRVYDATDPSSPEGGVPLPQTTTTFDGNPVQVNQPCVGYGQPSTVSRGSAGMPTPARTRYDARSVSTEPTWVTAKISAVFADPDNAYLSATIHAEDGQLIVMQAQMPTFPNTNAGQPAWTPAEVRYWSICENNGVLPVVVACSADFDSVESGDTATFVISTPSNRPPNATAAAGVNWLPWGSSPYGVIIYRQMLADPSFAESIASVPAGGSAMATMGPYVPRIAYCSDAEFAAAGAAGCLGSTST
jgi:hypothetical protein